MNRESRRIWRLKFLEGYLVCTLEIFSIASDTHYILHDCIGEAERKNFMLRYLNFQVLELNVWDLKVVESKNDHVVGDGWEKPWHWGQKNENDRPNSKFLS